LIEIPVQIVEEELAKKLRTLDLSKNNLSDVGRLCMLVELKSLNLDENNLFAGSLEALTKLTKLQNLSIAGNKLGKPAPTKTTTTTSSSSPSPTVQVLPTLPSTLKQLNLSSNFLSSIPQSLMSSPLSKLEKLDLSSNHLATIPDEISNLEKLEELRLDSNSIVSLPETIGRLSKLKVMSLRNNQIQVSKTSSTSEKNKTQQQPLPKSLFTDTSLIDLNLHGNRLTNTEMNRFEGYQDFLDRRQKVKSKTMSNFDVCGLE
jgi:Leucine-rich repeat (LRR) protein